MHAFTALVLPWSGVPSRARDAPGTRKKGESALAHSSSLFFAPSWQGLSRVRRVGYGIRAPVMVRGAQVSRGEEEDRGWRAAEKGGELIGDRRAGLRGDTRGYKKVGEEGEKRLRHPRERRWPAANPRRVYPSNLRYAPNPVYPRKNPFYPGRGDSGGEDGQITIEVQDRNGVGKGDALPSSGSDEPESETYLRRLLNARSVEPKRSKSHIREAEDLSEGGEGTSGSGLPYGRKRTASADVVAVDRRVSSDEKALRQALKLRREQTREAMREHLKEAQLSKTYSQLVVDSMPGFVDHVLVQAVALKSQDRYVTSTFVARARACLAETKVSAIVKWMKHNHITFPRIGKLVDLKGTDLDGLRERIEFLKKNYVRGRDLGVVLTRHPVILDRPLEELRNTLQLLEDAGVRRSWVGFIISRSPGVLALSIDELLDKILFFQGLGVKPEYFGPMAFNFPASIGRFPLTEMQAKVDFLRQLGLADSTIGKAISMRPQLLACDIENGWQRLLKYFKFLGIQDAGIQRIFTVHPSVFCMNLEKNIAPKVRFFRAIGIREDALGQVLVDFPALLSYSMDRKIRPVVRFILEEAGVKEAHIGKVIALRPQLIGTGLTLRLKPLVQYLRNQQLRREEIGHMVADFPMLLRYNLVIVESKFRYFKRHMKRPIEDLILFPRFFSYSLEGRIKPRQKILKSNDIVLHLRSMLACNDEKFDQRVEAAIERRNRGMSSDETLELETDDEESAHEQALTTDWVPTETNVWGALKGDSFEDADLVDFDAAAAWLAEEDKLDAEEYAAGYDASDDEELSGPIRIQNEEYHPYRIASKERASEPEGDVWSSHGGDTPEQTHIEGNKNESSWEDVDDSIIGEDTDFLMKYCV